MLLREAITVTLLAVVISVTAVVLVLLMSPALPRAAGVQHRVGHPPNRASKEVRI
jgi:hypothetical protein